MVYIMSRHVRNNFEKKYTYTHTQLFFEGPSDKYADMERVISMATVISCQIKIEHSHY